MLFLGRDDVYCMAHGDGRMHRFLEDYEHELEYNKLAIELITRDEKWIRSKADELECFYYDTGNASTMCLCGHCKCECE